MHEVASPFDRRTLVWLAVIGGGSLLLAIYLLLAVPRAPDVTSHDADAFSRSAIGHRAFLELLRAERLPVIVSRHSSAGRASDSAILALLEPRVGDARYRIEPMLGVAKTTLLVLPKWRGRPDEARPGWLRSVTLIDTADVDGVLAAAEVDGHVRRDSGRGALVCGDWTADIAWPQLLEGAMETLVGCGGGTLLGLVRGDDGARIFVLSDPDVLANHGLGRGDNAALALQAVRQAGAPGKTLIVDETLHGYEAPPSLWRSLFELPLVVAVIHVLLSVAALVWAGLPRFGAPVPVTPAIESGKRVLIENTASLLKLGGHHGYALARYFESAVQAVRTALHVPERERTNEVLARLAARAPADVSVDIRRVAPLVERIASGAGAGEAVVLSLAQKIHQWKEETIRGRRASAGR